MVYVPTNEELQKLIHDCLPYTMKGKIASYIPALKKAKQNDFSVAIYTVAGECFYAGNVDKKFTLQSISKVMALALVLEELGEEKVFSVVGMEPTGDPFNSIAKLELNNLSKPLNPMINAGALAVTNLISGNTADQKWQKFVHFVQRLSNNKEISYNEEIANSELDTAFLNRSLAYFLKQHGMIGGDVEELLYVYTRQCAVEMNCFDLARIGAVFALEGKDPVSGRQILSKKIARICKTFMVTCGMYNASGEFAIKVGIPAKSGVSGGILGIVPNRFGIGVYSPALDDKGNSYAGWKLLELLNQKYEISIF